MPPKLGRGAGAIQCVQNDNIASCMDQEKANALNSFFIKAPNLLYH